MIRGGLAALQNRNVLILGATVIILLLWVGGLATTGVALGRLERTVATRSQALREIERLRGEARFLQQQIGQREAKLARTEGGSAVTILEGLAGRLAGQGRLAYLRPLSALAQDGLQAETVELKLERLSLEQVLRLLWEIENSPAAPMRVAELRLQRRFDDHALIDLTATISAYRK